MKLMQSIGPNPQVVKMFIAERGLDIERQEVDLMAGENRQEQYLKLNPAGQLPALILDNGSVISEITAICEYLDEVSAGTSLIGDSAEQKAETRMWLRRLDLGVCDPMTSGFRAIEGRPLFESRMKIYSPEAGVELKALAQDKLAWLDAQLDGNEFICGNRFSLADIFLFCFLEFGASVGQAIDNQNKNILAWHEKVNTRASATAQ